MAEQPDAAVPAENTERDDLVPLVGPDFVVPQELRTERTVLRPLRAEHNEADHRAWTSNIEHIRATPGFGPPRKWPEAGMPLDKNLEDLVAHSDHFDQRLGFTYTVLDATNPATVVGCVYIYEDPSGEHEVEVRSWTVAEPPDLDHEVWSAVSSWLATDWPFARVAYAARG